MSSSSGHDSAASDQVAATIGTWQERMLQLDRSNNLLYFPARTANVPIDADDLDEFVKSLQSRRGRTFDWAERRQGSDEPYVMEGDIKADIPPLELQKKLRTLRRRDREYTEEQGINVLFLATGFLSWRDVDGEMARSPILLAPCDLEQASSRDHVQLRQEDDDVSINETLRFQLAKIGFELPAFEDIDSDTPITDYLAILSKQIEGKEDWSVDQGAALSTFQFSKVAMWTDLEQLKSGGGGSSLVRSLALGAQQDPVAKKDHNPRGPLRG